MRPLPSPSVPADLEAPVLLVEQNLSELHQALQADDIQALEQAASALHRSLTGAVEHFRAAAQRGALPSPLRDRLALASARVAAQRQALARATASLDRAIDVLLPERKPTYAASGLAARFKSVGAVSA
jgi:ABC-type transporter Mla subunit MlaD